LAEPLPIPQREEILRTRARAPCSSFYILDACCTDKKEKIFFPHMWEILNGAVAKSYMRKGFLIQT
jgi:hypothetical protein